MRQALETVAIIAVAVILTPFMILYLVVCVVLMLAGAIQLKLRRGNRLKT